MGTLAIINPSRRKRHGKKRRTPAQRAATRRMLAANRASRGGSVKRNPLFSFGRKRRTKRYHAVARRSRRRVRRNPFGLRGMRGMSGNVFGLMKAGAIGAGGALTVDIGMGMLMKAVPLNAQGQSPIAKFNADGSTNWFYYLTKGGIALALGTLGRKLPFIGKHAGQMAEGSFTVMSYDLLRNMLGANLPLGAYFNPAPVGRPAAGMGKYMPTPAGAVPRIRSNGQGAGARASAVLSAVQNRR